MGISEPLENRKEKVLEIPESLTNEEEATKWILKRGASLGNVSDFLDPWKEKVQAKLEKKRIAEQKIENERKAEIARKKAQTAVPKAVTPKPKTNNVQTKVKNGISDLSRS